MYEGQKGQIFCLIFFHLDFLNTYLSYFYSLSSVVMKEWNWGVIYGVGVVKSLAIYHFKTVFSLLKQLKLIKANLIRKMMYLKDSG